MEDKRLEACPIETVFEGEPEDVPVICEEVCGDRFQIGEKLGDTDFFDWDEHQNQCPNPENFSIDGTDSALINYGNGRRAFSIVDLCGDCGHGLWEERYKFLCRLAINDAT